MVAPMSDTPPVKIPQQARQSTGEWQAAAGYLLLALALLWPLSRHLATHLPGDPFGDPLLNAWILGWDADRLLHGLRGLWQAPLFYPAPDTLAWSEHLLGIAIFTAPVYWLTDNIVLTYNVALLGSTALAGFGMYLLALELTGRRDAAWLAGLAFACLPYRIAQITHVQVLASGWMPLALLGLHRYFRTGSRRALAGFAAAYVLQGLSNGYFLFFLAVPVAIVSGWHLVVRLGTRDRVGRTIGELAIAALAIGLVMAPVVSAYLRVRATQGFTRSRGEMVLYAATPAAYGTVASTARLWKDHLPIGKPETELFPGFTLVVLAACGLAAARRRADAGLYAAVAAAAFVLTLGPEPDFGAWRWTTGPYDWLLSLPGLSGLRVPARFAMVVYLGLAALAAFGAASLLRRAPRPVALALTTAATVAIVAEGLPAVGAIRFPTPDMSVERAAYEWLRDQSRGPMLELPVGGTREAVRYLTRTLVHGNRIVNGYSGYGGALQDFFAGPPSVEQGQTAELLRAARIVGLRYVLVHQHLYGDRMFAADLVRTIRDDREQVERVEDFGTTSVAVLRPARTAISRPADPVLPLDGCRVEASHNQETAPRAIDGDTATRWLTATPQRGDEWLLVRCAAARTLTSLRLGTAHRSFGDYPRRLVVERSLDGVEFEPWWEGTVVAPLAESIARNDRPPSIRIDLPPAPFTAVRLRQIGQTPRRWFWSVDELQLHGRE